MVYVRGLPDFKVGIWEKNVEIENRFLSRQYRFLCVNNTWQIKKKAKCTKFVRTLLQIDRCPWIHCYKKLCTLKCIIYI